MFYVYFFSLLCIRLSFLLHSFILRTLFLVFSILPPCLNHYAMFESLRHILTHCLPRWLKSIFLCLFSLYSLYLHYTFLIILVKLFCFSELFSSYSYERFYHISYKRFHFPCFNFMFLFPIQILCLFLFLSYKWFLTSVLSINSSFNNFFILPYFRFSRFVHCIYFWILQL